MKKPPYHEIIDLKAEQKEYSRLCSGKSENFTLYSEWEDHIKGLLANFGSPKDLNNFKHYCINRARSQEKGPEVFWCVMALLIPVYLDTVWNGMPWPVTLTLVVALIIVAMHRSKKVAGESCFFTDIIEVIESIEET